MDKYKIKSGILGLIIGDALGVPVEMKKRIELEANPVTEMTGYGTWNQPQGTWSDDSSLTLCLMASLINGYKLKNIGEMFVKWYRGGLYTPHGKNFGTGKATTEAIEKLIQGDEPYYLGSSDERSNGNGSLMRILPLAYFLRASDFSERARIIGEVSAITHGHRRSILACEIYINFAINLLNGLDKISAYNNMKLTIRSYYPNDIEIDTFSRIIEKNISEFSREDISASPYVVHTLEAAIWCFLKFDSYKEVVLNAVNLGQDADTTAAVVGGLAGIFYGIENIPKEWVNKIIKIDEITELLDEFELYIEMENLNILPKIRDAIKGIFSIPKVKWENRESGIFGCEGQGFAVVYYCFGKDKNGEYLDYYYVHRFGDSHVRIHESGEQENLPIYPLGARNYSEDPIKNREYEEEFQRECSEVYRILKEKGFER